MSYYLTSYMSVFRASDKPAWLEEIADSPQVVDRIRNRRSA
jgi:hypothetical protein